MKETLQTISRRTGFSISTVSRVLSGKAEKYRICESTVALIKEEAAKRGYTPSALAKSLRTSKSDTIGLIVPSIANPYFADIASVILAEARQYGYSTIIEDSSENETLQESLIGDLVSRQVDGIIVVPCGTDASLLEKIARDNVPVIQIDRFIEGSSLPFVVSDNCDGGFKGAEILLKAGHRDIACIQGVHDSTPNRERIKGFKAAMAQFADAAGSIVGNAFSIENGYLETKLLLHRPKRPSAIFALSNTIALGVMKALREEGLSIPEDMSLISFDNIVYLDYMQPPITRISQSVEKVGRMAVKILLEMIENPRSDTRQPSDSLTSPRNEDRTTDPIQEKLPVDLVLRDSISEHARTVFE